LFQGNNLGGAQTLSMPKRPYQAVALWIALLIAALLPACQRAAESGGMVSAEIPAALIPEDPALLSGIGIGTVKGGRTDGVLARAEISDADLRKAVTESLSRQGLLATGEPRYRLDVRLVSARQGLAELLFGLDVTVTATITYTLSDVRTATPVFVERVDAGGTARTRDYFDEGQRSRVAAERAVSGNIGRFLNRLYALPASTIGASDF
jgi:hypothetical protein